MHGSSRSITRLAAVVAAGVALTLGSGAVPAQAAENDVTSFYQPPSTLPAGNGVIVKSAPMAYYTDILRWGRLPGTTTRILYTSTDHAGARTVVSGVVIVPTSSYSGARPIVGFAPGTHGMADRCAPSRQADSGTDYEASTVKSFLSAGFAVALTDYQGLGTPGRHTYMVAGDQAHALLDVVRAARQLGGYGITSSSPVGLFGYSQGGGAAAAAAEAAASYAPELPVKGVVAGAVPADLAKVAAALDGSFWALFATYGAMGLDAGYSLNTLSVFTLTGRSYVARAMDSCVLDAPGFAYTSSRYLTVDGRSITQYLATAPWSAAVAAQRLGGVKPSMPVYVAHSMFDDTIPYAIGKQLAKDWCATGANVVFSTNYALSHVLGEGPAASEGISFLKKRFAGSAQTSNCGAF